MRVVRASDQSTLVAQCERAERFWPRLKGWIGKGAVDEDEGLWFPRCNSVHMWWMSVAIDVVFLTQISEGRYRVTSVHMKAQPWRALPLWDFKASDALELAIGSIQRMGIQAGEEILCIN